VKASGAALTLRANLKESLRALGLVGTEIREPALAPQVTEFVPFSDDPENEQNTKARRLRTLVRTSPIMADHQAVL
jgi:hypothetical protein